MSQLKVVRKDSSLNKGVHCECQKQIIDGKKITVMFIVCRERGLLVGGPSAYLGGGVEDSPLFL